MAQLAQQAVNAIIRPPRKEYDELSIPQYLQGEDGTKFIRHPIGFVNSRNIPLVGSYYHAVDAPATGGGPCVFYLHGNASSQLEGQFLVPNLCPYGIYVCCFDFAGCGCSGGDYVSLGYFEKQDTEFYIEQMHQIFNLGPFILWGRSMGAATALLVKHPLVVGRIVDSAFTSVPDMCSAIAQSMHLPSFFVPAVIWFLKKQVIQHASFDIEEVSPISVENEKEVPAVFGHADEDQFIPFEQCRRLFDHYNTKEKFLMTLEGGHNSRRKKSWIRLGVSFIFQQLGIEVAELQISTCRKLQESVFHFSSFTAMVEKTDAKGGETTDQIISDYRDAMENEKEERRRRRKKRHHRHHRKHKKHHRRHHHSSDEDEEDENNDEKEKEESEGSEEAENEEKSAGKTATNDEDMIQLSSSSNKDSNEDENDE